eukprot:scaffold59348_cov21-Tisochrysis_lutea.AAC.1
MARRIQPYSIKSLMGTPLQDVCGFCCILMLFELLGMSLGRQIALVLKWCTCSGKKGCAQIC